MVRPKETRPVAIVAGASGGLGSATARVLAYEGYCLVLMSRSGCKSIPEETGGVGVARSVLNDDDVERTVAGALNALAELMPRSLKHEDSARS